MTTKEKIYEAANRKNYYGVSGGYVNTDGAWSLIRTPEQFKKFLEDEFGFDIIRCNQWKGSTAVALTSSGLEISWNGFCRFRHI